jgi:reactive intermediate/imine deaminase
MKHFNSPSLARPNGYSHAIEVGAGRTIYVSGQIAMDAAGRIVGPGDIMAQTHQVFENLKVALRAADATLDNVVKITVFMTDISQIAGFREVRNMYFTKTPPTSSLVEVRNLVRPELLIEIEAVAVVE